MPDLYMTFKIQHCLSQFYISHSCIINMLQFMIIINMLQWQHCDNHKFVWITTLRLAISYKIVVIKSHSRSSVIMISCNFVIILQLCDNDKLKIVTFVVIITTGDSWKFLTIIYLSYKIVIIINMWQTDIWMFHHVSKSE